MTQNFLDAIYFYNNKKKQRYTIRDVTDNDIIKKINYNIISAIKYYFNINLCVPEFNQVLLLHCNVVLKNEIITMSIKKV